MAFNFPNSPVNGTTYTPPGGPAYVYRPPGWETVVGTSGGGGGGGSGDDLDTTLVAPTSSTLARTMPQWLAGAPVIECPGDVLVSHNHISCWLHMLNAIGSLVILPDDWQPGWSFGVRQIGTGTALWAFAAGSTIQLPFSKAGHTGLAEQYEEAVFRVITNTIGNNAVWGVSGGTF